MWKAYIWSNYAKIDVFLQCDDFSFLLWTGRLPDSNVLLHNGELTHHITPVSNWGRSTTHSSSWDTITHNEVWGSAPLDVVSILTGDHSSLNADHCGHCLDGPLFCWMLWTRAGSSIRALHWFYATCPCETLSHPSPPPNHPSNSPIPKIKT